MHVKNDAHPNIYCKTIIFGSGLFIDRTQFNVNKVLKKKKKFVGFQFTNAQHTISKEQQLKRLNKSLCQA
jgi:hypothetical protein